MNPLEQARMSERLDPVLSEYFDQYVVIGIVAGADQQSDGCWLQKLGGDPADVVDFENHVLAAAAAIMKKRRAGQDRRRRRHVQG